MDDKKKKIIDKTLTIVGIVLCVILIPILIMNVTMIIKSYTNDQEVPGIGKTVPFIVLTESMDPIIKAGDMIICSKIDDPSTLKKGDIISFFDPAGNGVSVVTHRIIEDPVVTESGKLQFITKGDNNNTNDSLPVSEDKVIAVYKFRIPGLGRLSMFMSTTPGLIICVFCPLALLIGYDVIRRKIYEKNNQQDTDALLAELEALKAEKAALQDAPSNQEQSSDVSEDKPE